MDIEKDKPLTACYTYTMAGTLSRQDHLKKGKYFTCELQIKYANPLINELLMFNFLLGECARCVDPTGKILIFFIVTKCYFLYIL